MTVDILIVFSMLLTGFDAPRLKRLYLGRKLSDHNLLQALTRVNRPYKDMHYGYIVDFADIKANFDQTNAAYLRELGRFSDPDEVGEGADVNAFVNIIEDPRVLVNMVREARQVLFSFDIENAEVFSAQISAIDDKQQLIEIRKALVTAKEAMNVARTFGDDELKEAISRIEVSKLPELLSEVERAIGILNQKEVFESADETRHYINEAMADIVFHFRVKSEEEMEMVAGKQEEFQQKWQGSSGVSPRTSIKRIPSMCLCERRSCSVSRSELRHGDVRRLRRGVEGARRDHGQADEDQARQ